jgi:hypothetical protein
MTRCPPVSRILSVLGLALVLSACDRPARSTTVPRAQVGVAAAGQPAPVASAPSFHFRQVTNDALKGAGRLTLVDLNDDGKLDAAAVGQQRPDAPQVTTLLKVDLGDGMGGFAEHVAHPVADPQLGRIASGDLNYDGHMDLALGGHDSYDTVILHGDGEGSFGGKPILLPMASGQRPHTHSLVVADMNGDGRDDLLSTCADDHALAVQLAQPDGSFRPATGSPFPAGTHPYEGLACVDVNEDGQLDAVVVNLMGQAISVLLGDGTGRLTQAPGSPLPAGERPGYSVVGDLDADGHLDIVASHDDFGILAVYYGDGKGAFTAAPGSPLQSPERAWHVAIADLDGDGRAELLTGDVDSGEVCIRAGGRYSGSLPAPQRIATGLPQDPQSAGGYFSVADLNGDSKLDIVASHWDTGDAVVLLQE